MDTITMGNDILNLYYRRNNPESQINNRELGNKFWNWISKKDPEAELLEEDVPCLWGDDAQNVSETCLPKTAARFQFDRSCLVDLFTYIDSL